MIPQRHYRNLLYAIKETKEEHSTASFTYINKMNPSTKEEASSEVFEVYEAEYSNDERYGAFITTNRTLIISRRLVVLSRMVTDRSDG